MIERIRKKARKKGGVRGEGVWKRGRKKQQKTRKMRETRMER
jgi:hypothetical protein